MGCERAVNAPIPSHPAGPEPSRAIPGHPEPSRATLRPPPTASPELLVDLDTCDDDQVLTQQRVKKLSHKFFLSIKIDASRDRPMRHATGASREHRPPMPVSRNANRPMMRHTRDRRDQCVTRRGRKLRPPCCEAPRSGRKGAASAHGCLLYTSPSPRD